MKRIALVGFGCVALAVAAASAAGPRWHAIPKRMVVTQSSYPSMPLGWASGRAWFISQVDSRLVFVSARVTGRGLTSFVRSDLRAYTTSHFPVLGSSFLVYGKSGPTQIVRLGSNGRVGDMHPIAGDPEAKAQALFDKEVEFRTTDAAEVGGRTVWLIPGMIPELGHRAVLAACCTTSGDARDLTSLLSNRRRGGFAYSIGVDGQGRLWFFWVDCIGPCALGEMRAVQLDRETLAPRAVQTASREASSAYGRFHLVCAAACRLVFQKSNVDDIWSWAGTGSPTKIARGHTGHDVRSFRARSLLDAGSRGGRLGIAYSEAGGPGLPRIVSARGNAKGLHLRTVSSTRPPDTLGRGATPWGSPTAIFTPRGVVAIQAYGKFQVSLIGTAVLR